MLAIMRSANVSRCIAGVVLIVRCACDLKAGMLYTPECFTQVICTIGHDLYDHCVWAVACLRGFFFESYN